MRKQTLTSLGSAGADVSVPVAKVPVFTVAKASITGPRWSGLPFFLDDVASACGVRLKAASVKGIIRETVSFELTGADADVQRALAMIGETVKVHNQ